MKKVSLRVLLVTCSTSYVMVKQHETHVNFYAITLIDTTHEKMYHSFMRNVSCVGLLFFSCALEGILFLSITFEGVLFFP